MKFFSLKHVSITSPNLVRKDKLIIWTWFVSQYPNLLIKLQNESWEWLGGATFNKIHADALF